MSALTGKSSTLGPEDVAPRAPALRFGLTLWLAGMVGVLSTLLMPLPLPEGVELPFPLWVAKALSLIQPTALLALAVWGGVALAPKVGLGAPVFQAIAAGGDVSGPLRPTVLPGLAGGVLGGALLVAAGFFTPAALAGAEELFDPPLVTRVLYGGVTEELLVRWGLMTFLLWAGWRVLQRDAELPGAGLAWCAIILAALAFGALHLPVAFALARQVTAYLVAYIVGANALFGVVAGFLFWKRGLESAIIAHATAHVIAFIIVQAGITS